MKTRLPLQVGALLALLVLSSCGYTKIGRITADPARYRNRGVHVEGKVTNSFGVLSAGGYQLEDETGKIVVLSNRGVPSKGSRVTVSGTVVEGVTVLGHSYGTSIQEHDHHVRY